MSIQSCFLLPAGTEDTHALQEMLRDAKAPALTKMQVPLVTMLVQVWCQSHTDLLFWQEKRYQPTIVYAVILWLLAALLVLFNATVIWTVFSYIAAFSNGLGTHQSFSDLTQAVQLSHQKSLPCLNIKNISKIRIFNLLNKQDFPYLSWCQ